MIVLLIAAVIVYLLYRIGTAGKGVGVKDIDDLLK